AQSTKRGAVALSSSVADNDTNSQSLSSAATFVELRNACREVIVKPDSLQNLQRLHQLVEKLTPEQCRTYIDLVLLPLIRCLRQASDRLTSTELAELLATLAILFSRQLPLSAEHQQKCPPVPQLLLILSELSSLIQRQQIALTTDEHLRRPVLSAISSTVELCPLSKIPTLMSSQQLPLFAHLVTFAFDAGIAVDPGDADDRCAGAACLNSLLRLRLCDIGEREDNDSDDFCDTEATDASIVTSGKKAVSEFLRPLLPGLVSRLGGVLSGSIRLNTQSRCAIIRVLRRVLILGMASNDSIVVATAKRVDSWLEGAIRPDSEANWRVRLEICRLCGRLLCHLLPSLSSTEAADIMRPRLLNRLLRLCADQQPRVSSVAMSFLNSECNEEAGCKIDQVALSMCDSLEQLSSSCHGNRDELLACLNGLAGCCNVRPSSGRLCLRSSRHREQLIRGLAYCLAPDSSRLSLVEDADALDDDDAEMDDGLDADVTETIRLLLTRLSGEPSDVDSGDLLVDATLDCLASISQNSTTSNSERRLRLGYLALLASIASRCTGIEATKQRLLDSALSILNTAESSDFPATMSLAVVSLSAGQLGTANARDRRDSAASRRLALRLVGRLGRHFSDDQTLPMHCLYACLAACSHPLTTVRSAALRCLTLLAQSTQNNSIGDLIGANADYVFNQCLVKLLGPPTPEPFAVLHSALAHCNADVLPALEPLVVRLCDRVDRHYERLHRMLVPLLAFLLRSLCRLFGIDTERHLLDNALTMPCKSAEDCQPRETAAAVAVRELLAGWRRRHGDSESSSNDINNSNSNDDDDPRQPKPPPPLHARLCQQVIDRLIHLTHFDDDANVRRCALTGLTYAAYAMAYNDGPAQERLLPTVHSLWPVTVSRLTDIDSSVSLEAVNTVLAVATLSGEFVRSRVADDVIGPLCRRLLPAALARAPTWMPAVCRRSQEFRRLCSVLRSLGPLAVRSRLQLSSLDLLLSNGLAPFLSNKLPAELRLSAVESVRCIYSVEPSLVWYRLYKLCPRIAHLSPSSMVAAYDFTVPANLIELRSSLLKSADHTRYSNGHEFWDSAVAIFEF
ncbi:hypothetical protein BOX15_Mlig026068g1, partial [Macrostomum lignano]